jgi:uncharacterized repeat protein (TIGR03843 family)
VTEQVLEILRGGEITVEGRFANSSNVTLLTTVTLGDEVISAVYKPEQGERPLWDFPGGLWRREVAAWVVSESVGLKMVPPTVGRHDASFGPGSLQLFVEEDEGEHHYFTLREDPETHDAFRRLAAFDVVTNNSDRKSGHVLLADGKLWAIDHGLCFHDEDKLRTVVWDFAGDELDEVTAIGISQIVDSVPDELLELLERPEIEALRWRAGHLLDEGALPQPDEDAPWPPYPWPLV